MATLGIVRASSQSTGGTHELLSTGQRLRGHQELWGDGGQDAPASLGHVC